MLLTLGVGPTLVALAPSYNPFHVLLALNLAAAIGSVVHEVGMRLPVTIGIAPGGAAGRLYAQDPHA